MKRKGKTTQRTILFRQNVNRDNEEWAHFLEGYREWLMERLYEALRPVRRTPDDFKAELADRGRASVREVCETGCGSDTRERPCVISCVPKKGRREGAGLFASLARELTS